MKKEEMPVVADVETGFYTSAITDSNIRLCVCLMMS